MAEWYDDYLNSEHWKRTRIHRLLRADINDEWNLIRCDRTECGIYVPLEAIDVHHLTYERVGRERMEDLQIVCRSCHKVIHGYLPSLWWEYAKKTGAKSVSWHTINRDRNIKRIGEVVLQCLAFYEGREMERQSRGKRIDTVLTESNYEKRVTSSTAARTAAAEDRRTH